MTPSGQLAARLEDLASAPSRVQSVRGFRPRRWQQYAGLLLGYLCLSLILYRRLLLHPTQVTLGSGQGDAAMFLWWLRWVPYALGHGLDPLYSHYLNAPAGADGMWNTSVLAPGLLLAPVTEIFGAVVAFNLAMVVAPALAALTASRWLARYRGPVPAAIGGLVFGFSPFVILHGRLHPNLTSLFLVPVIVMLAEDVLWRTERPWWPRAPLLGVVVCVQVLTSSEIMVMTCVGLIVEGVLLVLFYPQQALVRLRPALLGLGVAMVVGLVLCAVPLVDQFSGGHAVRGPVQGVDFYEAQPADLVNAPAAMVLHTAHSAAASTQARGEEAYVGVPLLVLLAGATFALRRRRDILVAMATLIMLFIFALGGRLERSNGTHHGPRLPWGILEDHITLLRNVLTVRFMAIAWLAIAFVLAAVLQESLTSRTLVRRAVLTVGTLCCLVPLVPHAEPAGRVPPVPAFFTSRAVNELPRGQVAVVLPMATAEYDDSMFWQIESGMRFAQVGGVALHPAGPRHTASWSSHAATLEFLFGIRSDGTYFTGALTPSLRTAALAEIRTSGARTIVVGPSIAFGRQLSLVTAILGRPPDQAIGGVGLWRL